MYENFPALATNRSHLARQGAELTLHSWAQDGDIGRGLDNFQVLIRGQGVLEGSPSRDEAWLMRIWPTGSSF